MPELTEILEELRDGTSGDKISLGDIVAEFQDRGFGPLLLAPALVSMLPTGAIPGVPAICAIFIILISSQLLFGRNHPWLPERLKSFSFGRKAFERSIEKAKPYTRRIDALIGSRLEFLTGDLAQRVVAMISILLAIVMIPLEVIPLACAAPAGSIALFALGLSAQDGIIMLVGFIIAIGAGILTWHIWPF